MPRNSRLECGAASGFDCVAATPAGLTPQSTNRAIRAMLLRWISGIRRVPQRGISTEANLKTLPQSGALQIGSALLVDHIDRALATNYNPQSNRRRLQRLVRLQSSTRCLQARARRLRYRSETRPCPTATLQPAKEPQSPLVRARSGLPAFLPEMLLIDRGGNSARTNGVDPYPALGQFQSHGSG